MDKYQTIGSRLGALFTDSIIFIPVSYIISYIIWVIINLPQSLILSVPILANSIVAIYYIYLHSKGGQTFGKRIFEVKVVDLTESEITLQQSILRSLPQILQILVLVLIQASLTSPESPFSKFLIEEVAVLFYFLLFIWHIADIIVALSNEKHRALHDFIAGTVVIKL